MKKPLIAGNWKMYKSTDEALRFADEFKKLYTASDVQVAILAPFTQLLPLKEAFYGTGVRIGAQNMHFKQEGAYTGEISPLMLSEIGVDYCIIGHSERRQYFGETDETVNQKLHAAFAFDILPILCVGECLEEREAGKEAEIVTKQMTLALTGLADENVKNLTVAYEPIWAIGTGRTASPAQADEMCGQIRQVLSDLYGDETSDCVKILYGGSVKPENATELMNMYEIDGALVGGASLKPSDFIEIINF